MGTDAHLHQGWQGMKAFQWLCRTSISTMLLCDATEGPVSKPSLGQSRHWGTQRPLWEWKIQVGQGWGIFTEECYFVDKRRTCFRDRRASGIHFQQGEIRSLAFTLQRTVRVVAVCCATSSHMPLGSLITPHNLHYETLTKDSLLWRLHTSIPSGPQQRMGHKSTQESSDTELTWEKSKL